MTAPSQIRRRRVLDAGLLGGAFWRLGGASCSRWVSLISLASPYTARPGRIVKRELDPLAASCKSGLRVSRLFQHSFQGYACFHGKIIQTTLGR